MANVPITSLPEATAPSAGDYLILQGAITQRIKWSALLDKLYPVGCIYQSAEATSPASLFGGTWERIKDKFILSAGDTYAAGNIGGTAIHSHAYRLLYDAYYNGFTQDDKKLLQTFNYATSAANPAIIAGTEGQVIGNSGVASSTTTFKSVTKYQLDGVTNTSSSMPPYVAYYVWRRIA